MSWFKRKQAPQKSPEELAREKAANEAIARALEDAAGGKAAQKPAGVPKELGQMARDASPPVVSQRPPASVGPVTAPKTGLVELSADERKLVRAIVFAITDNGDFTRAFDVLAGGEQQVTANHASFYLRARSDRTKFREVRHNLGRAFLAEEKIPLERRQEVFRDLFDKANTKAAMFSLAKKDAELEAIAKG